MLDEPLNALPTPGKQSLALRVKPNAEAKLRAGHPWLYDNAITRISREGLPGDTAVVFDRKGRFLAAGLYDPASPIRVRLLVHRQAEQIGPQLFARRLSDAHAVRAPLLQSETNGYRLIHGANDGLPGAVIDRYDDTYVLKLYSTAWVPRLRALLDELVSLVSPHRIVLRLSRQLQKRPQELYGLTDGLVLLGNQLKGAVTFLENGLLFEADVLHGQKTGFFLDQRENRQRVGDLAAGKTVLNAFSYSGGFSLYAARGGALAVIDVDQSVEALTAARRHFALNSGLPQVAAARHKVLQGDVFAVLPELAAEGRQFDVVILDPPAFARRKSEVERALSAYGHLARLGLAVLKPGGTLVASSCSSRITAEMFYDLVNQAARGAGRPLQEMERTAHGLDHPITFREGAYLKTLFARAP
ncbi:MAG: class I SAM-dependent rRNA methyltransferase [Candidatus Promineifilaceae bacterium]